MDRGLVMEQSVAGAAERSGIKKNKGKIAISSQEGMPIGGEGNKATAVSVIEQGNGRVL